VPAVVRPVLLAPRLAHDLQRLLEPFEPFRERRERHAQSGVLALVPHRADADAEHCTPARQHVQGRHDLGQQTRVAVGDTGDEQLQLDGTGVGGQKAEGV